MFTSKFVIHCKSPYVGAILVIAAEKGGLRIASELMRRWVQAKDNRE
jgi:hypothetical protein